MEKCDNHNACGCGHGSCGCGHAHGEKNLMMAAARIALTLVAAVVLQFVPIEGWGRFIAFLAVYIVISYDVLRKAVEGICHGEVFDENFLWLRRVFTNSLKSVITVQFFRKGSQKENKRQEQRI